MPGRTNIQWRSPTFVVLRTLQVLLAITILAIVVPKPGPGYNYPLQKRSLLLEPKRGGSYSSPSNDDEYEDDSDSGQTYARYVTPFLGMAAAALTILWCIYALWGYLRHTLRPKVSMGWDIVFMIIWLSLVICCAIGMVETDAWTDRIHFNPAQYTVFTVSSVTFFAFLCSFFIGKIGHREHGPGKTVLADEFEFVSPKTTAQSIPPQPHSPLVYSAGEERFVQVLPSPQPVYSGSQQPYAGSHYKPPNYR